MCFSEHVSLYSCVFPVACGRFFPPSLLCGAAFPFFFWVVLFSPSSFGWCCLSPSFSGVVVPSFPLPSKEGTGKAAPPTRRERGSTTTLLWVVVPSPSFVAALSWVVLPSLISPSGWCCFPPVLENHDTLAWHVQHAAATINWHRTGVDGRTPSQRRTGKSLRRVVALFGAENRWREGIFLGLFGAGHAANDYAIGPPDGVIAARAIKLEPVKSTRDVELLLSVKELPWDRKRRDPTIKVSVPRTPLPAQKPLPTES